MKYILLFLGPALFLLAELILPGGSADPATRIAIVQANDFAWELGHQIVLFALVFLLIWLGEVYSFLRGRNVRLAYLGALISAIALIADYGVGILQLHTLELARNESIELVQRVLTVSGGSSNLFLFAFLPTLGFLFGFGLLAIGFYRSTRQILPPILLGISGLLVALAGILQIKIIFILGALAMLAFTTLFARFIQMERA